MKTSVLAIIFSILLFACTNEGKQSQNSTAENEKTNNEILADGDQPLSNPPIQQAEEKEPIKENLSTTISVKEISFKGVDFIGSKERMTGIMGVPDSIVEPKYECGPYSEDWQDMKFYQYFFKNMNFIVYNDIAEIQNIEFVAAEQLKIKQVLFDGKMSFDQVATKLGISLKKGNYSKDYILIYPEEPRDENYILKFKDGKLHLFDRYEPC